MCARSSIFRKQSRVWSLAWRRCVRLLRHDTLCAGARAAETRLRVCARVCILCARACVCRASHLHLGHAAVHRVDGFHPDVAESARDRQLAAVVRKHHEAELDEAAGCAGKGRRNGGEREPGPDGSGRDESEQERQRAKCTRFASAESGERKAPARGARAQVRGEGRARAVRRRTPTAPLTARTASASLAGVWSCESSSTVSPHE